MGGRSLPHGKSEGGREGGRKKKGRKGVKGGDVGKC